MSNEIPGPNYYQFDFTPDGRVFMGDSSLNLHLESFYFVGDEKIAQAFGTSLPTQLADLIDVALSVYIADRLARRRQLRTGRYHFHWSRKIHVRLPLRNPELWQSRLLETTLKQVLGFFTDDEWSFEFVRRPNYRVTEIQPHLFQMPLREPITVALFSGGLDSLAGLTRDLNAHDGTFILFCAGTNRRTMHLQQRIAALLPMATDRNIIPVIVPFGLQHHSHRYNHEERSQRSRGFVYQALGAATAFLAGTDSLAVHENGIGAISLPYTAAQLGTQATRATHPLAVSAMSDLISIATGHRFTVRLPNLLVTKAQLCGKIHEFGLSSLIDRTVSCDGFPVRVAGQAQCGICTSCLLRRQALHAAGLAEHDQPSCYRYDALNLPRNLSIKKLYPLRSMLDQAAQIQHALREPEPWEALSFQFPQLIEVAAYAVRDDQSGTTVENLLVSLYSRYCAEWESFPVPQWDSAADQAA
jgi:7-cyano-7-deazaguanine synthase in queuosine biosynthesis